MGLGNILKGIANVGLDLIPGGGAAKLAVKGIGKALVNTPGAATGANPATDISQILGETAAGRATGRETEADLALKRGQLANSMYGNALTAKDLSASLPGVRASQAVRGDLMSNMQDVKASGPARVMKNVTHFSGGARPSALGPNARAAGAALSKIGLDNIGNETMPTAPTLPDLPEANAGDAILNTATPALGIAGAIGQYLKNKPQVQPGATPFADQGNPTSGAGLPGGQSLEDMWAELKRRQHMPSPMVGQPAPQSMVGANL